MENIVQIPSRCGNLESILDQQDDSRCVVVTHPHSLYGGDMHNSVVHTISSVFRANGYSTLRFNFRGVGNSAGSFGDGIGEVEDLQDAIDFMKDLGFESIELAGYSFGAWVIFNWAAERTVSNRIIMVSPPVDFIEFKSGATIDCLDLVICGDRDHFADRHHLQEQVKQWNANARLDILEGADHFFSSHFHKLSQHLESIF